MKIVEKKISELKECENNPRINKKAIEPVAQSIKAFGWKQPIVIDKNDVIVAGHTRYKAAIKLKMKTVPCVIADDLTDDEIKAYRIADNKTAEFADWDVAKLVKELDSISIDMSGFGEFDFSTVVGEVELKRMELKPYRRAHYLITVDINEHDRIIPLIEKLKEIGGVEIETSTN